MVQTLSAAPLRGDVGLEAAKHLYDQLLGKPDNYAVEVLTPAGSTGWEVIEGRDHVLISRRLYDELPAAVQAAMPMSANGIGRVQDVKIKLRALVPQVASSGSPTHLDKYRTPVLIATGVVAFAIAATLIIRHNRS